MSTNRLLMAIFLPLIVASLAAGFFLSGFLGTGEPQTNALDGSTAADPDQGALYVSGPFRISIRLVPETPDVGKNLVHVRIRDSAGAAVSGAEIKGYGEMAAMASMAAMRAPIEFKAIEPGVYVGRLELPMSGEWPLSLHIRKDGLGETRLGFDMATGRTGLQLSSGGQSLQPATGTAKLPAITGKPSGGYAAPQADERGFYRVGRYEMNVRFVGTPVVPGKNDVRVTVQADDGASIVDAELRAVLEPPGAPQTENQRISLAAIGDGIYAGTVTLSDEGEYALAVDVASESHGHGDLVLKLTAGGGESLRLEAATATPDGIAYYTCSMHTSVREAAPGSCPICGMDLVPVMEEQIQTGVITLDARRRQLIGVKTGTAMIKDVTKTIRAVGRVAYDERRSSEITLKFDGWIGDLKADYVGREVTRGQELFTVYAPELLAAQQEYLQSRRRLANREPDDSLVEAARRRLMLWDLSEAQVRLLERRGEPLDYLPIFAPKRGVIVAKSIVDGSFAAAGKPLLSIADLSRVWIDAEVYEADLPLVERGMPATVILPFATGRKLEAIVDHIYPALDPKTRTAPVRLVLENVDGTLKPDMYVEVQLLSELGRRLVVPEEAVLIAGESRIVFKDLDADGKLQPVRVTTGQRSDGWIEITAGLEEGDRVVTSGNFLIAAETKLKTGISQW